MIKHSPPVVRGLLDWACAQLGLSMADCQLQPLPGDASFRRYLRLLQTVPEPGQGSGQGAGQGAERSWMVCVAPPAQEKNREFLQVRQLLQDAGVRVPALYAADLERGWLLLEDLGDALLLPALTEFAVDGLYAQAQQMLLALARVTRPAAGHNTAAEVYGAYGQAAGEHAHSKLSLGLLPAYDRTLLQQELDLFPEWFERGLLGLSADASWEAQYAALSTLLIDNALLQPQVLVHRDFHSRNLMLTPAGELATIDFQDAVRGPLCYDLVSLLKDCYLSWPAAAVRRWALCHREQLLAAGLPAAPDDTTFLRWFDLMGLQRHLKVLGIFARLHLRDGKSAYLGDLPRVLAHIQPVLVQYASEPAVAALAQRLEQTLWPLIRQQPWWPGR